MTFAPGTWASALTALAAICGAPAAFAQANLEWSVLHGSSPLTILTTAPHAAVDAQGNVHVALRIRGSTGIYDLEVAQYDPNGSLLWTRRFDTGAANSELCSGIALAPNGDVCLAGWRGRDQSDLIALRYDSAGTLLHATTFAGAPGAGADAALGVAVDGQGNLVVAGLATDATGDVATLLQCYSPQGTLLFETRTDVAPAAYDVFTSLAIEGGGDIFAAGWIGVGADREALLAKFSASGVPQWIRVLPGSPTVQETFSVLTGDGQGGVVAGGNRVHPGPLGNPTSEGWVVRCDGGGTVLWSRVHPQGQAYYDTRTVLVDQGGVCWAMQIDLTSLNGTMVSRISPTGALLSSVLLPGFGGGLALGDAGEVFFCAEEPGGLQGNVPALTQLDSSGATSWHWTLGVPGVSAAPYGVLRAPNSRVVLHGYSKVVGTLGSSALVAQVDVSESPAAYCTGKQNSLGCTPRTVFTGLAQASAPAGFTVQVERLLNQKPGLFLYGIHGAAALPFGGGLLCVNAPVRRTVSSFSGGSPLPTQDCSGVTRIDMNAFAHGALGGSPAPELLVAGTRVWIQAWGRDNGFAAPSNVSLSSGLTFVVLP